METTENKIRKVHKKMHDITNNDDAVYSSIALCGKKWAHSSGSNADVNCEDCKNLISLEKNKNGNKQRT